nr:protein kinase-like domain, phloem protein 2-like protein [Tanacetum cinerariifolium]
MSGLVTHDLEGHEFETWDGDCMMVVKEIVYRLLEEVELEWWFEQEINDEGEDEEGDGGNGAMILVYEHASKGSLENYLGSSDKMANLNWKQRLKICLDIAHGLSYIHNNTDHGKQKMIHRDIKSENILLVDNWKAKIGDFGLSKFHPADQDASTFIASTIAVPTGRVVVPTGNVHNESINTQQQPNIQPQIITTVSNNNAKFPYLKKDEYEVWAMKMKYWITNNDMNIWNVIQNGNIMKRTGRDRGGRVIILLPKTVDEHIAVQRESNARTTLLQSIPDDHVADFHYMDDARDI